MTRRGGNASALRMADVLPPSHAQRRGRRGACHQAGQRPAPSARSPSAAARGRTGLTLPSPIFNSLILSLHLREIIYKPPRRVRQRHCERSKAIQSARRGLSIASSASPPRNDKSDAAGRQLVGSPSRRRKSSSSANSLWNENKLCS